MAFDPKTLGPRDTAPATRLKPQDISLVARIEQVPEAAVKAAIQAIGDNRAKVVAHLRMKKSERLH